MKNFARLAWVMGVAVGVVGLGGVGGCVRDDPGFKVTDMATAPGLVGSWVGKTTEGKVFTLKISEGVQGVSDGRLAARGSSGYDDAVAKKSSVPVYTLHADFPPPDALEGVEANEQAGGWGGRRWMCAGIC